MKRQKAISHAATLRLEKLEYTAVGIGPCAYCKQIHPLGKFDTNHGLLDLCSDCAHKAMNAIDRSIKKPRLPGGTGPAVSGGGIETNKRKH